VFNAASEDDLKMCFEYETLKKIIIFGIMLAKNLKKMKLSIYRYEDLEIYILHEIQFV
jgi:hypothetical protein